MIYRRVRTSSGTFLMRGQDAVIKRIEKRIADFTFIPVGMYVVPWVLVLSFVPWTIGVLFLYSRCYRFESKFAFGMGCFSSAPVVHLIQYLRSGMLVLVCRTRRRFASVAVQREWKIWGTLWLLSRRFQYQKRWSTDCYRTHVSVSNPLLRPSWLWSFHQPIFLRTTERDFTANSHDL